MTTSPRPAIAFATSVVVLALIGATLGLLLTSCASRQDASNSPHAAKSTATSAASSKKIVFDGVQLTIPAGWPVIDGAHAQYTCSSTFFDQADRAFLGPSYQEAHSCAPPAPTVKPPPADGVWLQPGGTQPAGETATKLPGGQRVWTAPQTSAVAVWFHGVSIRLGIGANPAVERSILDSIAYRPTATDTPVLGRCPARDPHPRCRCRAGSRRRSSWTTRTGRCSPRRRTSGRG